MVSEEGILTAEVERKARWDRVADHMRALAGRGCGGIVEPAQESKAALGEAMAVAKADQCTIDRLLLDLDECRAHLGGVLKELGKVRAERDAALARLSEPRSEQSDGVAVVELGVRLGGCVCGA